MAVTYRGSNSQGASNGSDASVNLSGLSLAENDIVVAVVAIADNDNTDFTMAVNEAGWTKVADLHADDTYDCDLGVFVKRMGATPDSAVTGTGQGGTDSSTCVAALALTGVDPTLDLSTLVSGGYVATASGTNTANADPPSIGSVVSGGAVVICGGCATNGGASVSLGAPTNYTTNAVSQAANDTSDAIAAVAYRTDASGTENPGAFAYSGSDSTSFSWGAVTIFLPEASSGPTITDAGDEDFRDGETSVVITGTNFSASGNTVELGDSATYGSANLVEQTITSEGTTSITITVVLSTLAPGALWLYVTDADTNVSNAYAVTVHRKVAWQLSASTHITASGENTGAMMTAPSGKTTGDFGGGRIQDDENPGDTVDLATDEYREDEWCIAATTDAIDSGVYEFRVLYDGAPADTISVTPTVTVQAATNITGSGTGVVAASFATGSGTGAIEYTGSGTGVVPSTIATGSGSGTALNPITGSGTGVFAGWTGSGTGVVEYTGSGTGVWADWTGSGTGTLGYAGSGTGVWAGWTGSGTGAIEYTGSGTGVWTGWTGTGTGFTATNPDGSGTGVVPSTFATGSGTGVETFTGSGTGVVPSTFAIGSGTGTQEFTGSGTGVWAGWTGSGTGIIGYEGSGTGVFAGWTGSGSGTVEYIGSGTGVFAGWTGSGTGNAAVQPDGSGTGVWAGWTGSGAGVETFTGSGTGVYAEWTGSGTGTLGYAGSGTGVFAGWTGSGSGVVEYIGSGTGVYAGWTGSGTGTTAVEPTGSGTGVYAGWTGSGAGVETFTGSGTGVFAGWTGSGTGEYGVNPDGSGTGVYAGWTGNGYGIGGVVEDVWVQGGGGITHDIDRWAKKIYETLYADIRGHGIGRTDLGAAGAGQARILPRVVCLGAAVLDLGARGRGRGALSFDVAKVAAERRQRRESDAAHSAQLEEIELLMFLGEL